MITILTMMTILTVVTTMTSTMTPNMIDHDNHNNNRHEITGARERPRYARTGSPVLPRRGCGCRRRAHRRCRGSVLPIVVGEAVLHRFRQRGAAGVLQVFCVCLFGLCVCVCCLLSYIYTSKYIYIGCILRVLSVFGCCSVPGVSDV